MEKVLQKEAEWIDDRYLDVEDKVSIKLHDKEQYQKIRQEMDLLTEQYPFIPQLLDDAGAISMTESEHAALVQYLNLQIQKENMERRELYYFGHADCIKYLKTIGVL